MAKPKVTVKMNPGAVRKLKQQVKNSPEFKKMERDLNDDLRSFAESLRGRPRTEVEAELRRFMKDRGIEPNGPNLAKLVSELADE